MKLRIAFSHYSFDTPLEALLSQDITCFFGSEDMVKDIKGWEDITSGTVHSHMLSGDHFYLLEPNNENFIKN
ncbi:S-acyl fatty acid synthase thioesterase, medium chain [Lemmus lemmus]